LSAVSSSSRRPFIAVTSGHRLRPLLRLLAAHGSLAPLRPPPLTSVLAGTAPPWCPLVGVVRHLWSALCSSPEPRSSTAPLPSRAYKRAAPSSSFPALATTIPPLPRPSSIRGRAAAFVFLPGEPSLSSPCPSVDPSSDCLSLLASPHRRGRSTPFPHPDFSPQARRRQPRREAPPPPREQPPPRPPLTKLSPPLGPPAPPRAKAPAHCPRTGPPAAGSSPRTAGSSPPRQPDAVLFPLLLSLARGARGDVVAPRAPAPSPLARGPPLGRKRARAGARARGGPKTLPPAQQRRYLFFFSFSTPFLI
jgi:hypothetical protein